MQKLKMLGMILIALGCGMTWAQDAEKQNTQAPEDSAVPHLYGVEIQDPGANKTNDTYLFWSDSPSLKSELRNGFLPSGDYQKGPAADYESLGTVTVPASKADFWFWADPGTSQSADHIFGQTFCAAYGPSGCAVSGFMRYPAVLSGFTYVWDTSVPRDLVIVAHGNGFHEDQYDYLVDHLAYNGFVVASIDFPNHQSIPNRVSYISSTVNYMLANFSANLTGNIALIGHSRGGEAVVSYANNQVGTTLQSKIKSVISLSNSYELGPELDLNSSAARSFLAMYGAQDEDIVGAVGSSILCRSALAVFDRFGSESSNFAAATTGVKAAIYLPGGNHSGFSEGLSSPLYQTHPYLGALNQRFITKAWINAFLRWQLHGETYYSGYFKRQWVPGSVAALSQLQDDQYGNGQGESPTVLVQYNLAQKLVVDNFENGNWATNTMGADVTKNNYVSVWENDTFDLESHSPHDSRGLKINWNKTSNIIPFLGFEIPNNYQNVSSYGYLSFRVAQIYGHSYNQASKKQNFRIRLYSGNVHATVTLSDYGDLVYPDKNSVTANGIQSDWSRSTFATFTIPLSDFAGVDLAHITDVRFLFDRTREDSSLVRGSVILDSVQFIK